MVLGLKIHLFRSVSLFLFVYFIGCKSLESDTLSIGQSLFANQTLISNEEKFELGFFSPGNSTRYYIGIWYKNIPVRTVVWVANIETPISQPLNSNSHLLLSNRTLSLLNNENIAVWRTNLTSATSNVTEAVLLDTGNFVVRDGGAIIWQSFDYPTDTWLPGARFGLYKTANTRQVLTSWKNSEDPSPGIYSIGLDPNGTAEFFIWRNGLRTYWRSGVWNGKTFNFMYEFNLLYNYNFRYVENNDTSYVTYNVSDKDAKTRLVMDISGQINLLTWVEQDQDWLMLWQRPIKLCEVYASCGPFGLCNGNSTPMCSCLPGFEPYSIQAWNLGDFSGGCRRKDKLDMNCDKNSVTVNYAKLPDIRMPAYSQSLQGVGSVECETSCSVNCSCNAYTFGHSGYCLLWIGDLLDLEQVDSNSSGEDISVKHDFHGLQATGSGKSFPLPLVVSLVSATLVLGSLFCYLCRRKLKRKGPKQIHQNLLLLDLNSTENNTHGEERSKSNELAMFSFSSVAAATRNFSSAKKLGEGGFGPVYKGELINGQLVAVKRLSKRSGQGLEEFRNETELIAKLQHRNLVGILGCCIEQDEMILIYEYMANTSLDSFLFGKKREVLVWDRRVKIIEGIAQGLLYLHQYSRLRIVHRDLKASNILLDGDMNPKISDFGMARIFGGNVLQANTNRIVGTYGYMSPEYAMEGLFSVKSDVFAFGVLLLEIISGKKINGFYGSEYPSLLGYAWELWKNDRALEIIDPEVQIPIPSTPTRLIQLGLLCVQDSAADRPPMSDVISMLSNEQSSLSCPKEPAFTAKRIVRYKSLNEGKLKIYSVNNLTISSVEGR